MEALKIKLYCSVTITYRYLKHMREIVEQSAKYRKKTQRHTKSEGSEKEICAVQIQEK